MPSFFSSRHLLMKTCIGGGGTFLAASTAYAQTTFSDQAVHTDWADAWLSFLFYGVPLNPNLWGMSASITPLVDAMRSMLSYYSYGMLGLAGLFVFYHLVRLILDTAQQGIPFGHKANPVWSPIRLVIAIVLLIPMSHGLSLGQHVIVKVAFAGSHLASRLWEPVHQGWGKSFTTLTPPRIPDLAPLITAASSLETCRLIYQNLYTTASKDKDMALIGPINGLVKTPSSRNGQEVWRASNSLNDFSPMCGEYRMDGYRYQGLLERPANDDVGRMMADVSNAAQSFSHLLADQANGLATRIAPLFLSPHNTDMPAFGSFDTVSAQQILTLKLTDHRQRIGQQMPLLVGKGADALRPLGWSSAGTLMFDFARQQQTYSALMDNLLPTLVPPVFAYAHLTRQALREAAEQRRLSKESYESALLFYDNVQQAIGSAHGWMFSNLEMAQHMAPLHTFDLRDLSHITSDPEQYSSLFTRGLDLSGLYHGVWGPTVDTSDQAFPLLSQRMANPLAALIEYGRRQQKLASDLLALTGAASTDQQATIPVFVFSTLALIIMIGGLGLTFVVPLLILARFLLGVFAWLIEICEAVFAIPIIALAHLSTEGSGLSGPIARQAYRIVLSLGIRPVLTLAGFIVGMIVFSLGCGVLSFTLHPLAHIVSPHHSAFSLSLEIGGILLFDTLALLLAYRAFECITLFPHLALRWLSPFVMTDGDNPGAPLPPSPHASPSPTDGQQRLGLGGLAAAGQRTMQRALAHLGPNTGNRAASHHSEKTNTPLKERPSPMALTPHIPEGYHDMPNTPLTANPSQPVMVSPLGPSTKPTPAPPPTTTETSPPVQTSGASTSTVTPGLSHGKTIASQPSPTNQPSPHRNSAFFHHDKDKPS